MTYQTQNPCENAYLYENILVLFNNYIHQDKVIHEYVKNTFNYLPENNNNKTLVVNNNELYSLTQQHNLIVCRSIDNKFLMNIEVFFYTLVEILSRGILQTYPDIEVANLLSTKLILYLPENIKVNLIGVRRNPETVDKDIFGNLLDAKMCVYIKTFEYTTKSNIKLIPFNYISQSTSQATQPFGSTTQPFGSTTQQANTQPFGSTTQPFGSTTQPFGSTTQQANTQPFGSTTQQANTQPFGSTTQQANTQPFGSTTQPFGSNTTTQATTQPFGSTTQPFGSNTTTQATTQPFGSTMQGQAFGVKDGVTQPPFVYQPFGATSTPATNFSNVFNSYKK
jgi:hypothetical protein